MYIFSIITEATTAALVPSTCSFGYIQSSLLEYLHCFLPYKVSCFGRMRLGHSSRYRIARRTPKTNDTIAFVLGCQVIPIGTGQNGWSRHEFGTIGGTASQWLKTPDNGPKEWVEFGTPVGIDKAWRNMKKLICGFCLPKVSSPKSV